MSKRSNGKQRRDFLGKLASQLGACPAKNHYPDRAAADRALAETMSREAFEQRAGRKLVVYRCTACGGFCLGNVGVAIPRVRGRRAG